MLFVLIVIGGKMKEVFVITYNSERIDNANHRNQIRSHFFTDALLNCGFGQINVRHIDAGVQERVGNTK